MLHFFVDTPKWGHHHPLGQPLEISGWCFFDDEAAHLLEIHIEDRLLVIRPPNAERPDVLTAYPQAQKFHEPVGFHHLVDMPKDLNLGRHKLQFFVISASSRREQGGIVEFEIVRTLRGRNAGMPPAGPAQRHLLSGTMDILRHLSRLTRRTRSQNGFLHRFADIPSHLVRKVNGTLSESDFVNIGIAIANVISQSTTNLDHARTILDFGCGLGRVLLPMQAKAPHARFTGFDIDPMMLFWCTHLLQDNTCRLVSTTLDLPDSEYDLVYAVSVFTHLHNTTNYWLSEIHRLLTPSGKAFITYHDETLFEEIAGSSSLPSVPKGTRLHDIHVHGQETPEGGATMGTFYTTENWTRTLETYFEVESCAPRGLFGHQSFSIVTKKEIQLNPILPYRQYIRSLEQDLFKLRQSQETLY